MSSLRHELPTTYSSCLPGRGWTWGSLARGRAGAGLEAKLLTVVAIAALVFQLVGATLARYAIISCGESGGETLKETAQGK